MPRISYGMLFLLGCSFEDSSASFNSFNLTLSPFSLTQSLSRKEKKGRKETLFVPLPLPWVLVTLMRGREEGSALGCFPPFSVMVFLAFNNLCFSARVQVLEFLCFSSFLFLNFFFVTKVPFQVPTVVVVQ